MKIKTARIVSGPLFAVVLLFTGGCDNKGSVSGDAPTPATASAEKNSFKEVTAKLDAGGNLYGYLSTEQWLDGLSGRIAEWRETFNGIARNDADRQNIIHGFDAAASLVKHSGIEDISGVGMSSIAREPGLYRNTFVLHHYQGKGSGFLWTMFGSKPHPLDGLDLLPASTAVATFSDLDLPLVWSVLDKEIGQSGIPGAQEVLAQLPAQFADATGLKLDQVLASFGGEYGLVVTLDESKMIAVPLPGQALQVPEPGVMLILKVKNDVIFDRLDAMLTSNPDFSSQVIRSDKDGVKMRTVAVPLPLPIQLRPTVARAGDYLFVASTDALITEALAVKAGKKPGLKASEEFKKLSKDLPANANQFSFVSEKFGQIYHQVQSQMMQNNPGMNDPGQAALFKKLMGVQKMAHAYSVSVNGDDGWTVWSNSSQDGRTVVLLVPVAATAVVAGVALPAFAKAKAKAQAIQQQNMQRNTPR